MRVLTCLYFEHDLVLVLLAAIMCLLGSLVTMTLFQRVLVEKGVSRLHWCFLAAVTAGASIWATHFIGMISYDPQVPVSFDGPLTIVSALIAVAGSGLGMMFACSRNRLFASVCGGGTIGLSIATMHYVGMFAYRADGIVSWLPAYVMASILAAVGLAAAAVDRLRAGSLEKPLVPSGLLFLSIVLLHFTGMAAFVVTPIAGIGHGTDSEAFTTLAGSIAFVAVMIIAAGLSTQRVDTRTRERSEEQLRHIALHDALTGLSNRHHFNEQLEARCAGLAEDSEPFALLLVDLDRFKPVNDTLGHPAGDSVLCKVARRLQHAVREVDLVARIGGDEFAIIARGLEDAEGAMALSHRIVELLSRPYVIDGDFAEIGASVGLVLAPLGGTDAETLSIHADVALYSAKRDGRGRACMFEPHLTEAIRIRRALEADLRRACVREQFHVVYQPVKDAGSDRFIGAEALVRWNCPKRGLVPPSDFIPVAEELGLIAQIGAFVLRRACLDAVTWRDDLSVAVNLSPVQLLDPRLPQMVANALAESGLAPDRLELEITETALLGNDDLALASLLELREVGVSISLDDFGTGYSSLSYLHRFPISRIKIDKSFVQQMPGDKNSASIVRAIAQLGSSLEMLITAEGIETDDQLSAIGEFGCDHVQGFLISKPIRAESIADIFGKGGGKKVAA